MGKSSLEEASEEEVCDFIQKIGLDPTPFRQNEVNGALLVSLNDDELREDLELSMPEISKLRAAMAVTPKTPTLVTGAETLPTEAPERNSKPEKEGDDCTTESSDISSDDEQSNDKKESLELQENDPEAVRRLRSLHTTKETDSLPTTEIEVIMAPSISPKHSAQKTSQASTAPQVETAPAPQVETPPAPQVETPPETWTMSGNPVYDDLPACAESSHDQRPTKQMSPTMAQPGVQITMESQPVYSPTVQMQPATMVQMQPATMVQMQPAVIMPMVPPTSQSMSPQSGTSCRYDDRVNWPALQKKHASSSLQDGMDVENMGNISDGQLAYDLQAGEQLHIVLDILHIFVRRKLWMIILYTILTFGVYLIYLFCCCCCRPKRSERSKASLALTSGGRLVYWENAAMGVQEKNKCCCIPGNRSIQSVTSMRYLPVNAITKIEHLYLKDNGLLPCLNFINKGPFRTRHMITLRIHFTKLDASESSFVGQANIFTRMKDALMGNQVSQVDADLEFIIDTRDKINTSSKDGLFSKMIEFEAALISRRSSKAAIKPSSVNTNYFQLTNEDCKLHKEVQAAGGEVRQRLSKMDAGKSEKGRGSTSRSKVWAVMINPAQIPMAPGESVQDALCTFRRWRLLDIYLCIQTWGLYYIFYLRKEMSASHAMILTDRRLINVTKQGLIGNKVQDAIHRTSSVILDKVKSGCIVKNQMGVRAAVQTKHGVLHIEPRHDPLNPCIWYLPSFYRSRHLDFVLKLASSVDAKNFLPGQSAAVWDVENAGMGMLDPLPSETVVGALDGDLGKGGAYCGPLTAPLTCFVLPFKLVQRLRVTTHRLWYYMYHKNFAPLPMCQSKSEIMAWSHLESMTGYEIYGETQIQETFFTRIMGCLGCTMMKCCTPGYAEMQFQINTKDMPNLPGDGLSLDPKPMFAVNRVNKKSKGDGLVATDDIAQARQMMGVIMAARQAHKSSSD